jgi:glycosyltransferase involved in cell wall biosynthesis
MKIVTISDNPNIFSGLAKVHKNVIDSLRQDGHEVVPVVWFAFDTRTLAMMQAGLDIPPPEYEGLTMLPMTQNKNAPLALKEVVETQRPDIVLTIGDPWKFYYVPAVKGKSDYSFKWVAYLTIEEEVISKKWTPLFRYIDALAVPSEFGKRSVINSTSCDSASVIPYGTDEQFQPCSPEKKARLRAERGIGKDKFRFITIAQNTSRKNLPSILQTAKLLKDGGDDRIEFYVHTNVDAFDPSETYSYDLKSLAKQLGVEDRVYFPSKKTSVFLAQKTEYLVEECQASDCYLSSSLSEGYGLPVMEAMACGIPVLANATTTMYELLGSDSLGRAPRGWLAKGRMDVFPPDRIARNVDPKDMAEHVANIAREGVSADLSESCASWAKERTWKGMGTSLCELLTRADSGIVLPVEEF